MILTHMMSIVDLLAICIEAPRIDNERSLEKELIELINVNK